MKCVLKLCLFLGHVYKWRSNAISIKDNIRLGTNVSFSKWLHRIHQMTIKIRPSFCLLSSPGNYFAVSLLPNRRKIFIDIWYKAVYWFNSPRYCTTLYNKRWSTFNLLLRMFILLLTSDRVIHKHLFSR